MTFDDGDKKIVKLCTFWLGDCNFKLLIVHEYKMYCIIVLWINVMWIKRITMIADHTDKSRLGFGLQSILNPKSMN